MSFAAAEEQKGRRRKRLALAGIALLGFLALSGVRPYDCATWWMEVAPVLLALPILAATWRRSPLTTLVYGCIFLHALVLMLGGAYTYARVPLGRWVADLFGWERNPYDRFGHFMQGVTPALVAWEIFIRGGFVRGRKMRAFLAVCVALAVSSTFEMVEWSAALAMGAGADHFLGTQGDPWDTQADMFAAMIGAIAALALLGGAHDRQIASLMDERKAMG